MSPRSNKSRGRRLSCKIHGGSGGNFYPLNDYVNDPQVSPIGNIASNLEPQPTYLNIMGGGNGDSVGGEECSCNKGGGGRRRRHYRSRKTTKKGGKGGGTKKRKHSSKKKSNK